MKAAYTGWTWLTAKDAETAKKQLEQSFKECKFLGYDYVENFAFIGDYFEDPNELIEMEKRCGVELDRPEVGNFHSAEVSRIYIRDVLDI